MKYFSQKFVAFDQSNRVCLREKSLANGLSWSHYQNANDRLVYQNDTNHTLSLYIDGGRETYRTDRKANPGGPGRFCLMPKGSESWWQVGEHQNFMHLYFDDLYLKQLALKVLDIDPRQIELPERIFFKNEGLEALFRFGMAGVDWSATENRLAMEHATDSILINLLQGLKLKQSHQAIKGGLSPKVLRQVEDFIHANYHRQIFLEELAQIAGLSEYHFCRMFKHSVAQSPQQYLTKIRIERVKQFITESDESLIDIAARCGFSNQSHMGRYFKKLNGVSPNAFRRQKLS